MAAPFDKNEFVGEASAAVAVNATAAVERSTVRIMENPLLVARMNEEEKFLLCRL